MRCSKPNSLRSILLPPPGPCPASAVCPGLPARGSRRPDADYLGGSVRWLLTGEDEQGLTLEERNLLVKYRSLGDRDRYEVNALLAAKLEGGY
ncbi:MAG: hypothetical protein LBU16_02480 [Treponema sp.]|jgi:hypothetical protein|nr:hypothetical protein [Treponema sp.]